MKLLLTSSGITNKSIEEALLDLLGKPFKNSNITFIPTAANVEKDSAEWLEEDINNFRKLGFKELEIIDISTVDKEIWHESFKNADVLVFGGGNVKYLLDWMELSGVTDALAELLKTKVYVGISAGSMVTAKNTSLSISDILYYEETGNLKSTPGLGLVDFEIRPHLNSPDFPKVKLDYLEELANDAPNTFYAIDDNTAIVISNDKFDIVTEGNFKKFDNK